MTHVWFDCCFCTELVAFPGLLTRPVWTADILPDCWWTHPDFAEFKRFSLRTAPCRDGSIWSFRWPVDPGWIWPPTVVVWSFCKVEGVFCTDCINERPKTELLGNWEPPWRPLDPAPRAEHLAFADLYTRGKVEGTLVAIIDWAGVVGDTSKWKSSIIMGSVLWWASFSWLTSCDPSESSYLKLCNGQQNSFKLLPQINTHL